MIFGASLALILGLLTTTLGCSFLTNTKPKPNIVVVGAGIAGLTAAHRLNQAGLSVSLFEASTRTGGRMWSSDVADLGHISEMGASFINSDHDSILRLLRELKLELVPLSKRPSWTNELVYGDGKTWTPEDFFSTAGRALQTMTGHRANIQQIDSSEDIETYLHGIQAPKVMRDMIRSQYHNECGLDLKEIDARFLLEETKVDFAKSRVNFISMLGDEAFAVKGGVSMITEALSRPFLSSIHFNQRLVEIAQNKDGTYVLKFENGDENSVVRADFVVLTVPLSILRDIRFQDVRLPDVVQQKMQHDALGQNDKVFFFYKTPFWRKDGLQNARIMLDEFELHDSTYGQAGVNSLTLMRGGSDAEAPLDEKFSDKIVQRLENMFPGSKKHFLKSAVGLNWPSWAYARGSYTCDFGPDYWYKSQTLIPQPATEGLIFAGELWGLSSQGYMDSAVESAEFAAGAIIKRAKALN